MHVGGEHGIEANGGVVCLDTLPSSKVIIAMGGCYGHHYYTSS